MSEELAQTSPVPLGRFHFYRIGATTLAQLRAATIIDHRIPEAIANRKPDCLVTTVDGKIKAVIEYKQPSAFRTTRQRQDVIDHALSLASPLCNVLVISTGSDTVWLNAKTGRHALDAQGNRIVQLLDAKQIRAQSWSNEEARQLEQLIDDLDRSLDANNDRLRRKAIKNPLPLARSMWQKIYVQTGKNPESVLYNVVELFVFKFLTDLGVLSPSEGFFRVYEMSFSESPENALRYYADYCRKTIERLFPAGTDRTTVIDGTIFVNEQGEAALPQADLFAEMLKHLYDYDQREGSFRNIHREFKTRVYETFLRRSRGLNNLGQFFTPRNVVKAMVAMSDAATLRPGARICDPFCGVGGFLLEMIVDNDQMLREYEPSGGEINPQFSVVGYDKGTGEKVDERVIILAKANMLIYFSDLLARHPDASFLSSFSHHGLNRVFRLVSTNLGTFGEIDDEPYDLILTNPPYITSGSGSLKDGIKAKGYWDFYGPGEGHGTAALAISWIVNMLAEGGQALVVLPDGLLRQEQVLSFIRSRCEVQCIISLPSQTFYSTPQKTYVLGLRRRSSPKQGPVFTYLVSETGETRDAKRYDIPENDLDEVVPLFRQFGASPSAFVNPSARCKIVSAMDFAVMDDWCVDLLWDADEKVELGVLKERPRYSGAEYVARLRRAVSEVREGCRDLEGDLVAGTSGMIGQHKVVSLSDDTLFRLLRGVNVNWNEDYYRTLDTKDEGDIPVYTADPSAVAHVRASEEVKVIEAGNGRKLFSFASNGAKAGTNFVVHDRPFIVSRDRIVIQVMSAEIAPAYLSYALRDMAFDNSFGWDRKPSMKRILAANIEFAVPTTATGEFDSVRQEEIAEAWKRLMELREGLQREIGRLEQVRIDL